ncbi:aldehyde dehydrogenase family protein [Candidatus Pelagibacter ubique]|nr:aldehyde dehydrogenase family protein [Candidatus Pelagibacter ubique]
MKIKELVRKGRISQLKINNFSQDKIDEIITAIAWEIIKPENNIMLCEMAVKDTGLGNVRDKILKNKRKTIGLLRDLKNIKTLGIISKDTKKGLTYIARPVGLIGAMTPATNPIATSLNKIINALKCRNAIILSPSPKAAKVCVKIVNLTHKALRRVGAPIHLVQSLPPFSNMMDTIELFGLVDLVVATGAQYNIKKAIETGTPTLGVGVGNVPSIVDANANLVDAAKKIKISKTFDNSTSCSSENSVIIISSVYKKFMNYLEKEGGVLLDSKEKKILAKKMWDKNSILNRDIIAKEASKIASAIGFNNKKYQKAKFLMVSEKGVGPKYSFSAEKLSPVLTVYKVNNFSQALKLAKKILKYQGQGHSCGIHSNNKKNILKIGKELPVSRVIVNQIHSFATGGSFDNGLPFSLSMGCGTWGKNIFDENLNYNHFLNITKIVEKIKINQPTEYEIFREYWKKYPSVSMRKNH